MIVLQKNGYLLLPEYDYGAVGDIAYHQWNKSLEKEGRLIKVDVIKNHSGSFGAYLGNQEGFYGGYQMIMDGILPLKETFINNMLVAV